MTRFPEPLRSALFEAVDAASKIIAAQEPLDVMWVTTPDVAGALSSTALSRGWQTSLAIRRAIAASPELTVLKAQDRSVFPSFVTVGGAGQAVDIDGLVGMLANAVREGRVATPDLAVASLEQAMGARSVRLRLWAPLGCRYVDGPAEPLLPLDLGHGVTFRLLSEAERSTERGLFDDDRAMVEPSRDFSVLETHYDAPASFFAAEVDAAPFLEAQRDLQRAIERVQRAHAALHVALPGRAPLRVLFVESTHPVVRNHRALRLTDAMAVLCTMFLDGLTRERAVIMKTVATTENGRVQVAMRRLRDAEMRSHWEDSLVDAAIGLEALLNAEHQDEITLRMGLNYASFFPMAERVGKAQLFRHLYVVRSAVAHGQHLNPLSEKSLGTAKRPVSEFATAARDMLREVLVAFLSDPTLLAHPKLTTGIWEERYYRDLASR